MRPASILLLALLCCWATTVFAQPDAEALARRLINSQGCKACHRLDGEGANSAPDLSKIGRHLNREQLHNILVSSNHLHAAGRIADFSYLQPNEIAALTLFLSQLQ